MTQIIITKPVTMINAAFALGKLLGFIGNEQLAVFDEMRYSEER